MPIESLNCPNCGAPLPDPAGRLMVMCTHCQTIVRVAETYTEPAAPAAPPAEARPATTPPADGPYTPPEPVPAAVSAKLVELLRAGRRLEAVEYYQSAAGVTADQARDVVDAIQAGLPPTVVPLGQVDLDQIKQLLANRRRTYAIQLYREQAGVTLSDAAKAIEAIEAGREPPPIVPAGSPRRLSATDLAVVRGLLDRNRKIEAIKLYRERTGVGLAEAKLAIEAIEGGGEPPEASMVRAVHKVPPGVDVAHIQGLLRQNKKIEAIAAYRAAAGLGLREAKDAVEAIAAATPGVNPALARSGSRGGSGRGCLNVALVMVLFMVVVLGGCGTVAQTTATYRCVIGAVKGEPMMEAVLGVEPNAGYLVLSPGYEHSFDLDGSWRLSMDLFMPAWGSRGLGFLYMEARADDSGYTVMRATLFKDFQRHVVRPWGEVRCH